MFDNTRFASITFQLLRLWHLEYSYFSINNDIAILRLSKDVTFNSNVVPACLPTNKAETYAGKDAVVSGWNQGALLQKTVCFVNQWVCEIWMADPQVLFWSGLIAHVQDGVQLPPVERQAQSWRRPQWRFWSSLKHPVPTWVFDFFSMHIKPITD